MGVVDRERTLYEDVYDAVSKYSEESESPGKVHFPMFREMAGLSEIGSDLSILDAGCGSGFGALAMREAGFKKIVMCDITDFGLTAALEDSGIPFYQTPLWDSLHVVAASTFGRRFDYVYCCDVMEHIPKEFTMLVVSRLLDVTRTGLFLSISLRLDVHGRWVGKHLHQTVEQFIWWRDNLSSLAEMVECRDLLHTGTFLIRPRGYHAK